MYNKTPKEQYSVNSPDNDTIWIKVKENGHKLTDCWSSCCTFLLFANIYYPQFTSEKGSWHVVLGGGYNNDDDVKKTWNHIMYRYMRKTITWLLRFPSWKCEGANQNRAWIIHEYEKVHWVGPRSLSIFETDHGFPTMIYTVPNANIVSLIQ